ncbi:M60 family metallopeptidase [Crenobacter luteus]|uniref:Peptidase M60 domain-containing protein n=1 Tax=Crenobacter luteus TaxID=1452487 RepID=A0A163BC70_9NEIS|nr:M60 family metallopeptidase [Crenobacter luteus]KZE25980.1 hypothetical protein AVW16_02855 [Crenobacter luteus]
MILPVFLAAFAAGFAGIVAAAPSDAGDLFIAERGWCLAREAPVVAGVAPCDGADPRQRWRADGGTLRPADAPALCLTARPDAAPALADCDGSGAQRWDPDGGALVGATGALALTRDNRLAVRAGDAAAPGQRWERLSTLAAQVDAARDVVVRYPLDAGDVAAVALERARHVVNQLTPPPAPLPVPRDVSGFPGAVPADAPRVVATVTMELRFRRFAHVGWTQKPQNWLATGLYAPAGETVSVTLPDDAAPGLFLRIGAHRDVIVRTKPGETLRRFADLNYVVPLRPGVNLVRSQYGGLLIVESRVPAAARVELTIGGAVHAPHFRLGRDDAAAWRRAREAPAPWAVLEGDEAVLVVPSDEVRALDDAAAVMRAYDEAQRAAQHLAGFDGSSARHPRLQGRQWFVADVQLSHGYGHAGFPIMTHLDWRLARVDAASNWGVMHETGHNYQAFCLWATRYGLESTVNLIPLFVAETLRGQPALIGTLRFSKAIAKLGPGFDFDRDADKEDKLVFLAQLRYAFPEQGWEIFRRLNRRYRELPADEQRAICASEARQVDTLFELLSDVVGRDLSLHFLNWGVPVSAAALARVGARGLPAPTFPTWLVNPE